MPTPTDRTTRMPTGHAAATPNDGAQTSPTGRLKTPTAKYLAANYVCLYADTSDEAGRQLAGQLAISQGRGIVISDRTGEFQAFSHDGDLPEADLNRQLHRFADRNMVVETTVTNLEERVSYYSPPAAPAPVVPAPAPVFNQFFLAPAFSGFSGRGC